MKQKPGCWDIRSEATVGCCCSLFLVLSHFNSVCFSSGRQGNNRQNDSGEVRTSHPAERIIGVSEVTCAREGVWD